MFAADDAADAEREDSMKTRYRETAHLIGLCAGLLGCVPSVAQGQPVYRCESAKGQVSYSNEPCLGATVVDTTPTQGLDKSSGVSRKGPDVQREQTRKALNDAMRPLTGMSHEEKKIFERRFKLPASVKLECKWLDARLPSQEAAVKNGDAKSLGEAETRLFLTRNRFRTLGC
ncbi:DUF4124 domain-containing protein [Hydrogenophaga sp.]|uniref:DUF4124 domain-containing protein n=1 Tax=Hydrogenophaga sp. TaxID=1904254 RepID=UPI00260AB925|nr:DUF4124 domain-containing protein [Hydrogenophaga sp.]MDM7950274.1 DUF4124 domain-containing protein [Hydrogenophaga sp.]